MVSNETKKICQKVEKDIEELIQTASTEFSGASSRLLAAKRMMDSMPNVPSSAWGPYHTLCDIPNQLNTMATAQLVSLMEPSGTRLNKMLEKKEMDVEEAWYIVEHLESLVKKAKVLTYTKAKHGFDAKCYVLMEKAVVKFREAVFNHRSVQLGLKKEQLEKDQKELVRVEKELEANKKSVIKCKDEISKTFEHYNDYVSKVLIEAKSEYQALLKSIENKQQELLKKSTQRMETFDLLARASIFNKKGRELAYRSAEDDYQKTYNELNQLRESLRSFAKVTFATKYDTIDKRIDDLLSKIKKLNDDISANETAIESYKNAIEGLKGELNG